MTRPARSVPSAESSPAGLDESSVAVLARLGVEAGAVEIIAVVWGTVDLERALVDLREPARLDVVAGPSARAPGTGLGTAVAVPAAVPSDDPFLGARVAVVGRPDRTPLLAVAEPSTEGRLAATLARRGEGPAGHYVLAPGGLAALRARAAAAGVALSRSRRGPFGRSSLVAIGGLGGPSLILVEPESLRGDGAAVPSRP